MTSRRGFIGGLGGAAAISSLPVYAVGADRPLFRAGLITDTHVGKTKETCGNVKAAWELFAKERVDLVANLGDIADHHYPTGYAAYRETVDEVLAAHAGWRPKELYVYAWHDAYDYKGDINRSVPRYREAFADVAKYLRANESFAEIELGGIPILVFPQMMTAEEYARYENAVKGAAERHPGVPVFVFDHIPPFGTVSGSSTGGGDARRRKILDRYPSVIAVTGHTHGTILEEKHIWQGNFTVVNCGCMYNWGGSLVGRSAPSRKARNAVIMEVYRNKVLFRRFPDVLEPVEHEPSTPWRIDIPYVNGKARYSHEKRALREVVGGFPAGAALTVAPVGKPMEAVKVSFPAAVKPPNMYKLEAFVKGPDGKPVRVLRRDLFGEYDVSAAKRARTLALEIPAGYLEPETDYGFTVCPYGFFGKEGPALKMPFKTPLKFAPQGGEKIYEIKGASEVLPVFAGWNGVKSIATCDKAGVYDLPAGLMRLHLPEGLWNAPVGTQYRFVCDFRLVNDGKGSHFVGIACPRPLRYFGRALTPPGDTGDIRTIINFTKSEEYRTFDICVEGGSKCSFVIKRLAVYIK